MSITFLLHFIVSHNHNYLTKRFIKKTIMYHNIHTYVTGFPYPTRFTSKTGSIFYVTCVVFTVHWTWYITVTAIHTKTITSYVKNEEAFEIFDNEHFDFKYHN